MNLFRPRRRPDEPVIGRITIRFFGFLTDEKGQPLQLPRPIYRQVAIVTWQTHQPHLFHCSPALYLNQIIPQFRSRASGTLLLDEIENHLRRLLAGPWRNPSQAQVPKVLLPSIDQIHHEGGEEYGSVKISVNQSLHVHVDAKRLRGSYSSVFWAHWNMTASYLHEVGEANRLPNLINNLLAQCGAHRDRGLQSLDPSVLFPADAQVPGHRAAPLTAEKQPKIISSSDFSRRGSEA